MKGFKGELPHWINLAKSLWEPIDGNIYICKLTLSEICVIMPGAMIRWGVKAEKLVITTAIQLRPQEEGLYPYVDEQLIESELDR